MNVHQMSLFDHMSFDENTPLPLIVAQRWTFPLRYVVEEDMHWYVVRDWVGGLVGTNNPKEAWQSARSAPEMQPILDTMRHIKLPGARGGSPAQVLDDKGLYHIAANMRVTKNRKALAEIKEFLAQAGAFADLMRRDPEARAALAVTAGPEAVLDATLKRYEGMGKPSNWIAARLEGVVTRKEFTSALRAAVLEASQSLYGKTTEKVYSGLWRRTTAELRDGLGIKKKEPLRDHFGEYALIYTRLAEKVATDKLKDAEIVPEALAMQIVYDAARLIREQANATSEALGIDLVTEKPLLRKGKGAVPLLDAPLPFEEEDDEDV